VAILILRGNATKEPAFMSTRLSTPSTEPWPSDVLEFAARRQVRDLLDPLRLALDRLFPTAQSVRVRLEEDPEIRDDRHLVFDVRVSRADVPDFGAAKRRWHEELFRVCPAPLVCLCRLTLVRVA
jgi:hypothetical protein